MDDPPAPGDPQSPAGPPGPQHREAGGEGSLGVDSAGTQTLMWLSDERAGAGSYYPFSEYFDVVLADREPGGRWSSSPSVVGTAYILNAQLAVNASGAAVATWFYVGVPGAGVYASYRAGAGADWAPKELVARNSSLEQVGIDDLGRVLLLFSRGQNKRERLYAARRLPDRGWEDPERLAGERWDLGAELAVGADGSAVVVRARLPYPDDIPRGSQFTLRMTSSGRWQPRVPQPALTALTAPLVGRSVDMDARGRVLLAWWDGADLMVRWSRPGGGWRRQCVLAAGVTSWADPYRQGAELAVNRRGDALVAWVDRGRVPQLWARYKPSGEGWTKPVKVTRTSRPPGSFAAELGDGGHATITWTSRNGRELHIVRTSPTH